MVSPFGTAHSGVSLGHRGQNVRAGLRLARVAQERIYPVFDGGGRSGLVVLGVESGGPWSTEPTAFIKALAKHKTIANPPLVRTAAAIAWTSRWSTLLAAAAMRPFACSFLTLPASRSTNVDGPCPPLCDVLASYADGGRSSAE